jgi:transposase
MKHYAGIDVSLESASVCIVDERGLIVREGKVASEPEALIEWLGKLGRPLELIGLEAGPLSQWLHGGLSQAGLQVELLETGQAEERGSSILQRVTAPRRWTDLVLTNLIMWRPPRRPRTEESARRQDQTSRGIDFSTPVTEMARSRQRPFKA